MADDRKGTGYGQKSCRGGRWRGRDDGGRSGGLCGCAGDGI